MNLFQVGGTLFQRDFFSYLPTGHIVLEGKDIVADDFAALAYGDYLREVLGIGQIAAVGRIIDTVVLVPDVPAQFGLRENRGDGHDFLDGHGLEGF